MIFRTPLLAGPQLRTPHLHGVAVVAGGGDGGKVIYGPRWLIIRESDAGNYDEDEALLLLLLAEAHR